MHIYEPEVLERWTPAEIASVLGRQSIILNHMNLDIKMPWDHVESAKFFEAVQMMEYKYCIPCKKNYELKVISLCPYSTAQFIKVFKAHLPLGKKRQNELLKIADRIKDKKLNIYAAGGIEAAPDHGVKSRKDLKTYLENVRVNIIDPCDFEFNKVYKSFDKFADKHNLKDLYWFTRKIVLTDLGYVINVDAVIVYLDQYIGVGTISECSTCAVLGIPVYGIKAPDFDIKQLKPWMMATVNRFFDSYNDLRDFIIG